MTSSDLLDLTGKVAVVTGAGRGLGRAMAEALAKRGAEVVGLSRTIDQVTDFVENVTRQGGRAHGYSLDVTHEKQVEGVCQQVLNDVGRVDILVNNAGNNIKKPVIPLPVSEGTTVGQPGSGSASVGFTRDEWNSLLDTHLWGSLNLMAQFVPGMFDNKWGRVINVGSSGVGRLPNLVTPYVVAKGTLTFLTRSLAKEWAAYGVTVNSISPGHFRTEMTKALHDSPEGQQWLMTRIPLQRTGDLEELGHLAAFLASDASAFITGQVIYADGGETL